MIIRDDYDRGVSKENELIKAIRDLCGFNCYKNDNAYDIDLVISLSKDKKILIEVEETSYRSWPNSSPKPNFPSGFLTMPIRKVKYFISDFSKLERKVINSIEDFLELYPPNTLFKPRSHENEIRLYIKGSYNLEYLCLVGEDTIIKSLNNKLDDQELVNKRILELQKERRKNRWIFWRNLWYNPDVKNMKGEYRSDPVLLILGLIDKSNDLIWIHRSNICTILKKLIKQKWGN